MAFMFENLQVYQKAVDLADRIAGLTEGFPHGYYFLVDRLEHGERHCTRHRHVDGYEWPASTS